MDLSHRRAISIIAHIDHGKTTLSDRILEICGAVEMRDMRAQYLDSMELERERGITIKLQSVRLNWRDHVINMADHGEGSVPLDLGHDCDNAPRCSYGR